MILVKVQWYLCWSLAMVLEVFPMGVVLLPFFGVESYSVGIWNIPVHIPWCSSLVLATSKSFWEVPASCIVLDVPHPPNRDFPSRFPSWSFCCLVHRFFLPYTPLYFLLRLDRLLFSMLEQPLSLLLCFFWFPWISSLILSQVFA